MGPGRERRARRGCERRRPPSLGSLPPRASPQQQCAWFPHVTLRRSFLPFLAPRSQIWDIQPSDLWGPSLRYADGHTEVRGGTMRAAFRLSLASQRLAQPRPWSRGPLLRPRPCPGRPAAAPGPPPSALRPVTCSLAPGPRAGGRRPGRQRAPLVQKCGITRAGRGQLGEEPCRCILFSKKIKYFHGKLSLCVFLSPTFSFCSFFLGCLPGSAPCLFLWGPHPAPFPVGLTLPGAQAVWRLARPCTPSMQTSPRPHGQREGQRVAVWPQVHE